MYGSLNRALFNGREIAHQVEKFCHSCVRDLSERPGALESMQLASVVDKGANLRYGVAEGLLQLFIAFGAGTGPLHKEEGLVRECRIEKQFVAFRRLG